MNTTNELKYDYETANALCDELWREDGDGQIGLSEAHEAKHFSTLKSAQKFIDKEMQTINKWYKVGGLADRGDEESKAVIAKTHDMFQQVKPVPFEVDVPEYI